MSHTALKTVQEIFEWKTAEHVYWPEFPHIRRKMYYAMNVVENELKTIKFLTKCLSHVVSQTLSQNVLVNVRSKDSISCNDLQKTKVSLQHENIKSDCTKLLAKGLLVR